MCVYKKRKGGVFIICIEIKINDSLKLVTFTRHEIITKHPPWFQ